MNKTLTWLIYFLTLIPLLMVLVMLLAFEEQGNNLVNIDHFNYAHEQFNLGVECVFANGAHEVDNLTC